MIRILTVCGLGIFLTLRASGQGTFQNLNFEAANVSSAAPNGRVSASNALPEWTIYGGYTYPDILFNAEALDSGSISILASNYPLGIPEVATGSYYVGLRNHTFDPTRKSAIGQTGQIPASANTLLLDGYEPPVVSFAGITIPLVEIGPRRGEYATVYAGSITAFAGQTGELRFGAFSYFDNIRFSNQPIPEPSTCTLFAFSVVLFSWRVKRCIHAVKRTQPSRPSCNRTPAWPPIRISITESGMFVKK